MSLSDFFLKTVEIFAGKFGGYKKSAYLCIRK